MSEINLEERFWDNFVGNFDITEILRLQTKQKTNNYQIMYRLMSSLGQPKNNMLGKQMVHV